MSLGSVSHMTFWQWAVSPHTSSIKSGYTGQPTISLINNEHSEEPRSHAFFWNNFQVDKPLEDHRVEPETFADDLKYRGHYIQRPDDRNVHYDQTSREGNGNLRKFEPVPSKYIEEGLKRPLQQSVKSFSSRTNPIDYHDRPNSGELQGFWNFMTWATLGATARVAAAAAGNAQLVGTPPFTTLHQWAEIDFDFTSPEERQFSIASGTFVPKNVLPLGLEVWKDRIFVTFPRWRPGVPATLATVPRVPTDAIPSLLQPYPDWTYHNVKGDCSGLTSVFRISTDHCGRLWVLDSGQIEALTTPQQLCPPQVIVFDLNTDKLIARYPIPEKYVLQNSLFSNIVTDSRDNSCSDLHIYITDVWRFGLIVFREMDKKFWRFSNHLFFPDPLASDYTLHGVNFQWTDGIFGLALSPEDSAGDKTLFYHPMSSFREFKVPVSVIRNESKVDTGLTHFELLGESRGRSGHSSASAVDRNGVLFYNLVTRDSIGCWDTKKPYTRKNQGVVAKNEETLIFPNDLKVDKEEPQHVWILTNKLPMFLYSSLDVNEINFRILYVDVKDAVYATICDPHVFLGSSDHSNLNITQECY